MKISHIKTMKTGDRFNNLVFIQFDVINNKTLGRFLCDCGKIYNCTASKIYKGVKHNCGCNNTINNRIDRLHRLGVNYGLYHLLDRTRYRCLIHQIEFKITIEDLLEIWLKQNKECYYTGVKLSLPNKSSNKNLTNQASIDPIDSNLGYTKSNIQFVDKDVNFLKFDLSEPKFLEICELISNKFQPQS